MFGLILFIIYLAGVVWVVRDERFTNAFLAIYYQNLRGLAITLFIVGVVLWPLVKILFLFREEDKP